MAFKLLDAGSVLRTITKCRVLDGGTLRNILRMKVLDADGVTLRTVATFAQPLSVEISYTVNATPIYDASAEVIGWNVAVAATATPTGGLGPYTYAWTAPPGWSVSPPNSASTSISGTSGHPPAASFSVTVNDSSGQTASDSETF